MKTTTVLILLTVMAVTALAQEAPSPPKLPNWKAVITAPGVTPTYRVTPGDNPIRFIQIIESSDWVGSFWGVAYNAGGAPGDTVQICPTFSTDADTSIALPTGAAFTFYETKLQWIVTHSGTGTFWGEGNP